MLSMLRKCNGRHRLFAPIRPIALTLCDVVSLARRNRFLALVLAGVVVLLLLSAHFAASHLESQTFDLVYAAIKAYLSKKATGMVYQGVLHWALSNGAFYIFRWVAYLVLYATYDLGRNVVFALSALVGITLIGGMSAAYQLAGAEALNMQVVAWTLLVASFLGWFWSRYMSGRTDDHHSFDFDVGAALVRLRPF